MPDNLTSQSNLDTSPALLMALTLYSVAIYKRFSEVGDAAARQAAQAAGDWSLEYPLWMHDGKREFPKRELPHFGERSSIFAIAVQGAYLVWTQKQLGNPLPDSCILKACEEGWNFWKLIPEKEGDPAYAEQ